MTGGNAIKGTILIVDDQQENIRVVGSVLTMCQYDIIAAGSAEQALRRLQARIPDLILLDVMMPDVDGLAACRMIKQNPAWAGIPVIFLSAADDKNVIVQALEAGGVDYVTKPFNRAELLSRVHTQMALKQARDDLRHLAEDKDELLGMLAHDLKNGMAGIQLSASLLAERADELPPRCASLAQNIADTSQRMLEHVKDFLANQRAGELKVHCLPLNLAAITAKVLHQNESAAAAKNIRLVPSAVSGETNVPGDHDALIQVLDNIITNAIKFTPPGGHVETAVRSGDGTVRVHISDSGPGFTAEDRLRLFARYQRLSARPTGNEPSTGLGLSIARKLLLLMHGDIILAPERSSAGGAEFILTMPALADDLPNGHPDC